MPSVSSVALAALASFLVAGVKAHGALDTITVAGTSYQAWNLEYYYNILGHQNNPQWKEPIPTTFSRKTDNLGNGFMNWDNKTLATGGWVVPQQQDGDSPVGQINANVGDTVTFQWKDWPAVGKHQGIIGEWMADCGGNCSGVDGTTLDWFSTGQHNYDPSNTQYPWPIDQFTVAGFKWDSKIPSCIPGGSYLMRHELVALHNYTNGITYPQYYPVAIELNLSGGAASMPANTPTVKFPGAYSPDDQIYHQNIYYGFDLALTEFPGGVKTISCGIATGAQNGKSGAGSGDSTGAAPLSSTATVGSSSAAAGTSVIATSAAASSSVPTPSASVSMPATGEEYGSSAGGKAPTVSGTLPVQGAVATGNSDEPEAVATGASTGQATSVPAPADAAVTTVDAAGVVPPSSSASVPVRPSGKPGKGHCKAGSRKRSAKRRL